MPEIIARRRGDQGIGDLDRPRIEIGRIEQPVDQGVQPPFLRQQRDHGRGFVSAFGHHTVDQGRQKRLTVADIMADQSPSQARLFSGFGQGGTFDAIPGDTGFERIENLFSPFIFNGWAGHGLVFYHS